MRCERCAEDPGGHGQWPTLALSHSGHSGVHFREVLVVSDLPLTPIIGRGDQFISTLTFLQAYREAEP